MTERSLLVEPYALQQSARTAVAAVLALFVARMFDPPEAYWAAITTLIIMQSNVEATVTVAVRRLAGTALGASLGAPLAASFGPNIVVFGVGVLLLGVLCTSLSHVHVRLSEYLDRTAYRYGSITLAIVMLVVRSEPAWIIAFHRFVQVSVGIVVGLALTVLWPEPEARIAR